MKKTICNLFMMLVSIDMSAQIIFSDFSDPDVCVGADGTYWMTASSFQCTPGLPLLHSNDLTEWELAGYAVDKLLPEEHYNKAQHGNGVWAPSMRFHDGTYYIYWGDPDFGVFMVKASDPRGKWSEPKLVMPAKGVIDTCPLWDNDGKAYLVNGWANSRCGFNSVLTVREMTPDGECIIGKPVMVYDGMPDGNFTIEGPKFYKRGEYYYILAPAGGVETGWQLALRSKNVYGPYEQKIVFNEEGMHQGGLVPLSTKGKKHDDSTLALGDKGAFICFQERGAYGRILHQLGVEWKNGWPEMKRAKIDKKYNGKQLVAEKGVSHYQWHANYQDMFGFPLAQGGQRIYSSVVDKNYTSVWDVPNLWLRKFDGETFSDTMDMTITAKSDGQQSGFIVMGRDYCRIAAELKGEQFVIKQITCVNADKGAKESEAIIGTVAAKKRFCGAKPEWQCDIRFVMDVAKGGKCHFRYSTDNGKTFKDIANDFQAREGKWIGAKYGAFSISPGNEARGWCDVKVKD